MTDSILEKRQKIEELEGDASLVQKALQAVVLPTMATLSKAFMLGFNNTEVRFCAFRGASMEVSATSDSEFYGDSKHTGFCKCTLEVDLKGQSSLLE